MSGDFSWKDLFPNGKEPHGEIEKRSMKKIFVISSTKFSSLKGALGQILVWENQGTLDPNAKIYEVKAVYSRKIKYLREKIL